MNKWFSHGKTFQQVLPPEECCSTCMRRCVAEHECVECDSKLKLFEPIREPQGLLKSKPVQYLSELLSKSDINERTPEDTPPYDTNSLAEAIVKNVIEFKSLESFREFLHLFSLGSEISKVLTEFVESNFEALKEEKFDLVLCTNFTEGNDDSKDDSYESDSSVESLRNVGINNKSRS